MADDADRVADRARSVRIEDEAARRGIVFRGRQHAGPCPACGGTDRFWIDTKKQAWGCRHCCTGGDVIQLVRHVDGVGFKEAIEILADEKIQRPKIACSASPSREGPDDATRRRYALAMWESARPIAGTAAESYLKSRKITMLPRALRFAPTICHRPSGKTLCAMIAQVRHGVTGEFLAVHRTYLSADGAKADVSPVKMALGNFSGGAVMLSDPHEGSLMVGEGVETCLAAMQAAGRPAWAALSTGGLRALLLPDSVSRVTILADGDEPGESAARAAGWRWRGEGRRAKIARPGAGLDFADLLAGE